jgi:hypothetical protein
MSLVKKLARIGISLVPILSLIVVVEATMTDVASAHPRIVDELSAGTNSGVIATSPGAIWMPNSTKDWVTKITETTRTVTAKLYYPYHATTVTYASISNEVWVIYSGASKVAVFDPTATPCTNIAICSIATFSVTSPLSLAYGTGKIFVAQNGPDKIIVFNASTNRYTKTITLPTTTVAAENMAVATGKLWVPLDSNLYTSTIEEITVTSGVVDHTIRVGKTPRYVALGNGKAWVSNFKSKTVSEITIALSDVEGTWSVKTTTVRVLICQSKIWVANGQAPYISEITPTLPTVPLFTLSTTWTPFDIACQGNHLWAAMNGPEPIYEITLLTQPAAPTNVVATAGNADVTINWTAPTTEGGSTVTGYSVQYSSNTESSWTTTSCSGTATSCTVRGLTNGTTYIFRVLATNTTGTSPYSTSSTPVTPETTSSITANPTPGYWLVGADGGVFSFGGAQFYGSMAQDPLNAPIVGIAATPDGKGYWLAGADGGVFSFGDADYFGSMGGEKLNAPVVGIATTPDGLGYWLVASDGGVFSFGDASFYGSMGQEKLNAQVVGIASTPDGLGYWLVGSDGGVFSFGDAYFYGSLVGQHLHSPIVGISANGGGLGYYLVGADGGVFAFGSASVSYVGSLPSDEITPAAPISALVANGEDDGYWIVGRDGGVFGFGGAARDFVGSLPALSITPNAPIVGIATEGFLPPI